MSSPFAGISIASSALRSFQQAIDVTGNNLANVNTDGYSRQEVHFADTPTTPYWQNGLKQMGTGVTIAQISRVRDNYLEVSRNNNAADSGKSSTLSSGLQQIGSVFGEPSTSGIANALDGFFNSFSALAADPSNGSKLASVRAAGQNLTSQVQGKYSDLQTLGTTTTTQINDTIGTIQTLANQIAGLNSQIGQNFGSVPNSLMDQRDKAVNQLAQLVNISTSPGDNNGLNVSVSGFSLVNNSTANTFPANYNAASSSVISGANSYAISGGQLGGLLNLSTNIAAQQGQLDTIANQLRTQVNTITMSGKNAAGQTGVQFFNDVAAGQPQTGAVDFDLSAAVKADYNAIPTGTSGKAGDGGLAQNISDLSASVNATLGNKSFGDYFNANMTALGSATAAQQNTDQANAALGTQISSQISAVSGVSVDDEMANMLQYQRAYQASAKMLTVYDQVLQTSIDMLVR